MQRRTVIATAGGIVSGGVLTTLASQDAGATAQVEFGTLDVGNRTYEQSSELQDVSIRVNANWKFDAERVPDRWELILKVGEPNNELIQIAETRMAPSSQADSGTEEISGSVLDGPFTIEQFRIDGSETTVSMVVGLTYRVVHNEQEVASASVQDTADLTVTPGSVDGSASIKGTGEIVLSK
jgi:carbonic anhydrase